MDQIAARQLGQETQLASLELALDSVAVLGNCDGASCALTNTLAWRTPTTPLPCENDPRGDLRATVRDERQHRRRGAARADPPRPQHVGLRG